MKSKSAFRPALFALSLVLSGAAGANCFNNGTVYCDGVVRTVYVADGRVYVSLGNSIGGALGCGTVGPPPGAAYAEYVIIDPALPQYAEKYQAVLVAGAALSNVLVYLVPNAQNQCAISGFLVQT